MNAADVGASSSLQSTPYGGSSPGYAISRESAAVTELAMAYHVANVGPLTVWLVVVGCFSVPPPLLMSFAKIRRCL